MTFRQLADRRTWWFISLLSAALLLLWPDLYNRFPLIFPDTSAYFQVTFGHKWTLDRSAFYGLILKPVTLANPIVGLWFAVLVQVLAIGAIILAAARRQVGTRGAALISIALIVLSTSLPWHAGQLMPDAFTGPLILLGWLLASRDLKDPGTPLLWLAATVIVLLHYTHLVILPATVLSVLLVRAMLGARRRQLVRNAIALLACCSAVMAVQVTANGMLFNRWAVSPMGPYFLFARLQEDGLVPAWMARHCGHDASPQLCALEQKMPRDSQMVLWGGSASPFDSRVNRHVGQADTWVWMDRMQTAVWGSIREEPFRFASNALKAGAKQFVHFQAVDDECPSECRFVGLSKSIPSLGAAIHSSRQVKEGLPKTLIRAVTGLAAVIGLFLLLPMAVLAWRKRDTDAASLLLAVAVGLCFNALVTGALSDVHDRYQSRVVWLAPFAVLLTAVRYAQRVRRTAISSKSETEAEDRSGRR